MSARFRTAATTAAAAVALVASGAASTMTTASAAPGTGNASGTISDPAGYPLGGVTVSLFDDGPDEGSIVATATTNTAGRYRFNKIATSGDTFRFEAKDLSGLHVHGCSSDFVIKKNDTATKNLTMKLAGII